MQIGRFYHSYDKQIHLVPWEPYAVTPSKALCGMEGGRFTEPTIRHPMCKKCENILKHQTK